MFRSQLKLLKIFFLTSIGKFYDLFSEEDLIKLKNLNDEKSIATGRNR